MSTFLMMAFIVFVFFVGMAWGYCMSRDLFNHRDYEDGFNKGYEAGVSYARQDLDELPF